MSVLHLLTLRIKIWLLRGLIRTISLFRALFGTAPYHTKFPPDHKLTIKSTCSPRQIKINVYEPKQFDPHSTYPVYINLHGMFRSLNTPSSGFILHLFGTDADFCRIISNRTGALVLDCDYAKSPEWPFPAAPEDVKDIVGYVLDNERGYFDTSRIAIGGFSSGAMLALTAGVSLPKGTLKGVVAIYPAANFSIDPDTRPVPTLSEGNPRVIPPSFLKLVYASYMPPGTDLLDPRLSPINTPASSLPEHVLVIVCEEDPLRDETIELVQKLRAEGVNVILKELPKVIHGWDKDAKEGTPGGIARRDAYEAAVETVKLAFESK